MSDEGPLGWLERIDDEDKKAALRDDLRALGLVGTIALLARPAAPDPEIAKEAVAAAKEALATRGKLPARKAVGRALHELYGLEGHGLIVEDASRALELCARSRGELDARDFARVLARCGKQAAKVVLGHLEEQIHLVHRLQTDELMPSEIDRPLCEFAPRIFAWRLPSMLKLLLPSEPKVRLAVVLWGRLRGLAIGKDALVHALDALVPEKPLTLVDALLPLDRKPLLSVARSADALLVEDAALGDLT